MDVGTLSGSNKVPGEGYVYRGTNTLNAAPFFYTQQSAAYGGTMPVNEVNLYLHRVVASGTVGGPLLRDKIFLFLGYNGVRVTDLRYRRPSAAAASCRCPFICASKGSC